MNNIKISYIILSFAFTLVILVAILHAYQQFYIVQPLHKSLSEIEDVIDKEIKITTKDKNIIVFMNTNELMARYQEILAVIDKRSKSDTYTVEIKDSNNQSIVSKYNDISFDIYEAIETKQYSRFHTIMNSVDTPYELQIEMDEKFIYLNLKNGEHYLYKLIPRNQMIG